MSGLDRCEARKIAEQVPAEPVLSKSLEEKFVPSVLFVCSANICRSPMAEGLLQARVGQQAVDWRIESAGVWALGDSPAAANTQKVLLERGLDFSAHRSRPVTFELLQGFDLILAMERGHKDALQAAFPQCADRVFLLSELVGRGFDVADPVGGSLADFEETASEIDQILDQGFARLQSLVGRE